MLEPESPLRLASLCGRLNEHIRQIEQRLSVKIQNRSNIFILSGSATAIKVASDILESLYTLTKTKPSLSPEIVHLSIQENLNSEAKTPELTEHSQGKAEHSQNNSAIHILKTPKCSVKPRGNHQNEYVHSVLQNDINFGIGPAGTGKTYLAVACAVDALVNDRVSRILLVRPAVEAGEKLGFLPGGLAPGLKLIL